MNQIDNITFKIADILGRNNDIPFVMSLRDTLWNTRAKYLRQDFDKNLLYRPSALQDLGDIPLVELSPSEKKRFSHCNIKRTEKEIPNPIETDFHNHYKFIGTADGSPDYQLTTEFEVENSKFQSAPDMFPSYFFKNRFLYVVSGGNSVRVITMFDNPREAHEFTDNSNAKCSILENAYTPKDMLDAIEAEMMQKYSITEKLNIEDKKPNEVQL